MGSPKKSIQVQPTSRAAREARLVRRFLTVYRSTASNLADQIQGRRQSLSSGSPFRRTHFARMRSHVLGGFHLAQQFLRVASDAVVVHFHDLDHALRVDDEG